MMKYFIQKGYIIVFFSVSEENIVNNILLNFYFSDEEINNIKLMNKNLLFDKYFRDNIKVDYFVFMINSSIPDFKGFLKI